MALLLPNGRVITDPDTIEFCAQCEELKDPTHRRIIRDVLRLLSQDADTTENTEATQAAELLRIYRDLSERSQGILARLARDLAKAQAAGIEYGSVAFGLDNPGDLGSTERPQTEAEKAFAERNRRRLDALEGAPGEPA